MKKIIYLVLLSAIVTACNDHTVSAPVAERNRKHDSVGAELTSRATAFQNIQRFLTVQGKLLGDTVIRGYTIRAVDLFGAMGMPGSYVDSTVCRYSHVRAYLGLDSSNKFKIYLLPAKDVSLDSSIGGVDLYLDSVGKIMEPQASAGVSAFVLDLNAPCPNTCAANQPVVGVQTSPNVKK